MNISFKFSIKFLASDLVLAMAVNRRVTSPFSAKGAIVGFNCLSNKSLISVSNWASPIPKNRKTLECKH